MLPDMTLIPAGRSSYAIFLVLSSSLPLLMALPPLSIDSDSESTLDGASAIGGDRDMRVRRGRLHEPRVRNGHAEFRALHKCTPISIFYQFLDHASKRQFPPKVDRHPKGIAIRQVRAVWKNRKIAKSQKRAQ